MKNFIASKLLNDDKNDVLNCFVELETQLADCEIDDSTIVNNCFKIIKKLKKMVLDDTTFEVLQHVDTLSLQLKQKNILDSLILSLQKSLMNITNEISMNNFDKINADKMEQQEKMQQYLTELHCLPLFALVDDAKFIEKIKSNFEKIPTPPLKI